MKVVILTGSEHGTAAAVVPALLDAGVEIGMAVVAGGAMKDPWRYRRRKLEKLVRIGPVGALNGIRMRRWYGERVARLMPEVVPLDALAKRFGFRLEHAPMVNCARTIELFKESGAELGLSLGNGYIGSKVFTTPRFGMINSHGEILPDFQNAQSVIWQIYEGSRTTGYTIHQVDKHIDTGPILFQERLPIDFRPTLADTVAHTCAAITRACAKGVAHVVTHYEELLERATVQRGGRSYTTPTIWQFGRMLVQHQRLYRTAQT